MTFHFVSRGSFSGANAECDVWSVSRIILLFLYEIN